MINFGKSPTKPKDGEGLGLGLTQEGGRSLLSAWCLFSSLWLCGDPCCQPTESWGIAPHSFWSSLASGIGIVSQAVWRNGTWGSTHSSDAALQIASFLQRTFQLHLSSKLGRNLLGAIQVTFLQRQWGLRKLIQIWKLNCFASSVLRQTDQGQFCR